MAEASTQKSPASGVDPGRPDISSTGTRSKEVLDIQQRLLTAGFDPGPRAAFSVPGRPTRSGVFRRPSDFGRTAGSGQRPRCNWRCIWIFAIRPGRCRILT
jgi:hypothetical protein